MGKTFKEQRDFFDDYDYNDRYTKVFMKRKLNKRSFKEEQEKAEKKYNDKNRYQKEDSEVFVTGID